jgi:diaminopimelate epimerase
MSAIGKSLPFTKMQAVGNDFVVVETPRLPVAVDLGALAIRLCDRHQGVGSDGLLAVGPSERADFRMRMFNPDGTEDMCGNGLRCSVRFVREHGLAAGATGTAECLDGLHAYEVNGDAITVAMARPEFALTDIPVDLDEYDGPRSTSHLGLRVRELGVDVNLDATNTGSTHSVIWCDTLPTSAGHPPPAHLGARGRRDAWLRHRCLRGGRPGARPQQNRDAGRARDFTRRHAHGPLGRRRN